MTSFGPADLKTLIADRPGPCVSLYAPVQPGGEENVIRWKNLLRTAERRLGAAGTSEADIDALLRPATQLLTDAQVWQAGSGVASFAAPGFAQIYRLGLRWPERATVGRVFDIRPVLPWLAGDQQFYVLAISQNAVRLLRCTAEGPTQVKLGGPANRDEALRVHDSDEPLIYHTFSRGPGRQDAIFHGHGVGIDDAKDDLLRYFRAVDHALHPVLKEEHAPLVLATVEYLLPIFRHACTYSHLFDTCVPGNPEHLTDRGLADRARSLIEPSFRKQRQAAVESYRQLDGTGRTSHELGEVVEAAYQGRVSAVYLALDRDVWGRFDAGAGRVEIHAAHEQGDEELTNLAAVFALRRGRPVHALPPDDMPTNAVLAAVFPLPLAKHGKRR